MARTEHFDVFLSHNSKDKPTVIQLSDELRTRGLRVWLDVEELIPGRPFQQALERVIQTTASAAILVGKDGLGPWEIPEMRACLQEFVRRALPVIPVFLPGAPTSPELPLFLREFIWVDLRDGITKPGIDRLVWGITGVKALETTRELVVVRAQRKEQQEKSSQFVDTWGIASVKSRLHALSEIVAQAASEEAALATAIYKEDILSVIVPIAFEMRWHRGYAAALERILKISRPQSRVRDFACEEVPGGCSVTEGILSAQHDREGRVLILLNESPALFVNDLKSEEQENLIESVNLHGRLGVPSKGGLSIKERIGEIPVRSAATLEDEMAASLFQNREVLAALVARLGMPGSEWLLTEEEQFKDLPRDSDKVSQPSRRPARDVRSDLTISTGVSTEEVLDARQAVDELSAVSNRTELMELLKSEAVRELFGDLVDTNPEYVLEMLKSLSHLES